MELFIRTDSINLTDSLRDLVTRRIRRALDKFGDRIVDTFVFLKRLSHIKGDGNMLCLVSVRMSGHNEMVIRETASTEAAALDRAARRVKHRVSAVLRDADRPSTELTKDNFSSRLVISANRANISNRSTAAPAVVPSAQRRAFSGTYSR